MLNHNIYTINVCYGHYKLRLYNNMFTYTFQIFNICFLDFSTLQKITVNTEAIECK